MCAPERSGWGGEIRDGATATDYRYTGQRDEFEIGLYYYVARYYDPVVGRFISADTLIPQPGSSQAYDRYAYVNNNPINFNDPSGHAQIDDDNVTCQSWNCVNNPYIYQSPIILPTYQQTTPILPIIPFSQWVYSDSVTISSINPDQCVYTDSVNTGVVTPPQKVQFNGPSQVFTLTPEMVATALDYGGRIGDFGTTMNWWHLPGPIGVSLDIASQATLDAGKGYTPLQQSLRVTMVTFEGQTIAGLSPLFAIPAAMTGIETGPGAIAFAVGGYMLGNIYLSNLADTLNNKYLFPAIDTILWSY